MALPKQFTRSWITMDAFFKLCCFIGDFALSAKRIIVTNHPMPDSAVNPSPFASITIPFAILTVDSQSHTSLHFISLSFNLFLYSPNFPNSGGGGWVWGWLWGQNPVHGDGEAWAERAGLPQPAGRDLGRLHLSCGWAVALQEHHRHEAIQPAWGHNVSCSCGSELKTSIFLVCIAQCCVAW